MKPRGPSAKRSWIMFLARCQRCGRVVRRSASPSRVSAGSYFQRSRGRVRDTEDGCRTDPASTGDHWVSPEVHQGAATPAGEKEPAILVRPSSPPCEHMQASNPAFPTSVLVRAKPYLLLRAFLSDRQWLAWGGDAFSTG